MAILLKDWGKHIRLGNWLYLWNMINKISHKTGHKIYLPKDYFLWDYLEHPPLFDEGMNADEPIFHFRRFDYTKEEDEWIINYFKENLNKNININLGSNCQSRKWWEDDREYVNSRLKIKEEKVQEIKDKYSHIFNGKKVIGIGIRRGDFLNSGCFYQIPTSWYLKALKEEFPDWENSNILFLSDNIEELKKLYKGDNFFFAEPNNTHTHIDNFKHYHKNPMEQYILGILCNGMVGGSSTFTWHQMNYIYDNGGKVVHCGKNLLGECYKNHFNPYYYPEDWTLNSVESE